MPANQRFRRARRRGRPALPVDAAHRLPHQDLRRPRSSTTCSPTAARSFEVGADPMTLPTMPVEFSVAAFRFGHSMIREQYDWNAEFPDGDGLPVLPVRLLRDLAAFLGGGPRRCRATGSPTGAGSTASPRSAATTSSRRRGEFNLARRIDTFLDPVLAALPDGSFGGKRDGLRARWRPTWRSATCCGPRWSSSPAASRWPSCCARAASPVTTLTKRQILGPGDGASLAALTDAEKQRFAADTPLWFYVLREAELNNGQAHRRRCAGSWPRPSTGPWRGRATRSSATPTGGPSLGAGAPGRFTMMDLLLVAYDDAKAVLAPLGD